MAHYHVLFLWTTNSESVKVEAVAEDIISIAGGFWIVEPVCGVMQATTKITKGSDARYWVPPSAILGVEKKEY